MKRYTGYHLRMTALHVCLLWIVPICFTGPLQEAYAEPSTLATAPATRPGPLKITVAQAVLLSLENNRSLSVQRLNPGIQQTLEDQEKAAFDPELSATLTAERVEGERLARSGSETEAFTTDTS